MRAVGRTDLCHQSAKLHICRTPLVFANYNSGSQDSTIVVGFDTRVADTDLSCHVPISTFYCTT